MEVTRKDFNARITNATSSPLKPIHFLQWETRYKTWWTVKDNPNHTYISLISSNKDLMVTIMSRSKGSWTKFQSRGSIRMTQATYRNK